MAEVATCQLEFQLSTTTQQNVREITSHLNAAAAAAARREGDDDDDDDDE